MSQTQSWLHPYYTICLIFFIPWRNYVLQRLSDALKCLQLVSGRVAHSTSWCWRPLYVLPQPFSLGRSLPSTRQCQYLETWFDPHNHWSLTLKEEDLRLCWLFNNASHLLTQKDYLPQVPTVLFEKSCITLQHRLRLGWYVIIKYHQTGVNSWVYVLWLLDTRLLHGFVDHNLVSSQM